ncbi:hypothetical protein [Vibrio natriegens]|uniref:hypothetical protein n=1 Tax=Vibrio natriegens TaxID=691 RepID=UPI003B5CCF20|nr:hypothetical protein [Vibrio parahaemolyticus]
MRYFSKRYKKKINSLLRLAKINDLPLCVVLDALKGNSDIKQDKRNKRHNGERIVWNEVDIRHSTVAFPLKTLNGKRLHSLAACFTLEQFHVLEEHYGQCPENIATKVIDVLSTK